MIDETARLLARGVAAIAAIANPQLVVLGGSIGSRPELIARVRALLPACMPAPVAVEPSRLGPHAALIGAAAIGLGHPHNALFGADAPEARLSLPPPRLAVAPRPGGCRARRSWQRSTARTRWRCCAAPSPARASPGPASFVRWCRKGGTGGAVTISLGAQLG